MFAPVFTLAQAITAPPAQQVILPPEVPESPDELLEPSPPLVPPRMVMETQEVRPLPGKLDSIPVFNSNSPEWVQKEGILLSTFPPQGKQTPSAHLNFAFKGRFDIFSHHIIKAKTRQQTNTMFQGIIVYNPNSQPVSLEILQGVSYLTQDALFVNLPPYLENPLGTVFAGPGSRATNDVLRGRRQDSFPAVMEIPAGKSRLLMNLPIPVAKMTPSSNGRTTLIRLSSSNAVYVATLAMFAPKDAKGKEQVPTLEKWEKLLKTGSLAGPRDLAPTLPGDKVPRVIYGRVAGVAEGSQWLARLTDQPQVDYLSIPQRGKAFSYILSTTHTGTFGTGQIQSAKMLARYPDTAYFAHGNYGVHYSLTFPLFNGDKQVREISIQMQTPVKANKSAEGLMFYDPPDNRVFFRGTVGVVYKDDDGAEQRRYVHLVQRRGQKGEALVSLNLKPGERRDVQVEFLYPPDATPPQVLTVRSD
ncbi:hypothetical protein BCD67_16790 [Oscillatoriales cyanobacterium USR001]|nr:hypothetical protein BCD67_16790 [Oscillatoriales cyanobacterium USR001]